MSTPTFTLPPTCAMLPQDPPTYPNPPTHHFSTITYPNRATLHHSTTSASALETAYNYGRLGGPTARLVESDLTILLSAHATLLTPTATSALVAATTPFLRAGATLLAPAASHPDLTVLQHQLLPRLGVRVAYYSSVDQLHAILSTSTRKDIPAVVLLQSPFAPRFAKLSPAPDSIPNLKAVCAGRTAHGQTPIFVLHNIGLFHTSATIFADDGVDVMTMSADRSGGLLDGNAALTLGVVACANERTYRMVRGAVRGKAGPSAAAPSPDHARMALFAMRGAAARRHLQEENVREVVRFLREGTVPGVRHVWSEEGSLDVGVELGNVDSFLDALRVIRIADGVGGGHAMTFAWPSWMNDVHHNDVVLSIGLEHITDLNNDIQQAAQAAHAD